MAYRFIILNGEQRGERRDIDNHSLSIGRAPESGLLLSDPDVLPEHALLIPEADGLMIRCLPEVNPVQINGIETRESRLRHGDVIQVGTTRVFVQILDNQVPWTKFPGLRKPRTWIAIGLPVLMLVATAILARHCRNPKAPPLPSSIATLPQVESTLYPDDCLVTNIPRVRIHDSISITSPPPEVISATEVMAASPMESSQKDISTAQTELEAATRFLQAAEQAEFQHRAMTNQESGTTDLIKAGGILNQPDGDTNAAPPAITNNPIQASPH